MLFSHIHLCSERNELGNGSWGGVCFGRFVFAADLDWASEKLVEAIPPGIIAAISVGIGLFITFIGLVNLHIVVRNEATLVSAGPLGATTLIGLRDCSLCCFSK